jgi:hypothetical protein
MNKGQGFAVGALLAAALLLRPLGSGTPQQAESPKGGTGEAVPAAPREAQEGPWIASCSYWAPARRLEDQRAKKPAEVHATLDTKNGEVNLQAHLKESGNTESPCGDKPQTRWGFPTQGGPINVTAIIATVPDPVHSHLAMTFDRTVDAILQAASDNDYVSSDYWLPWKPRGGTLTVAESPAGAEPGHDPERERQPGLMILKHVPREGAPTGSSESFYKVIYLFLVAETPTQGVDGWQLQNAFAYEAELKSALKGNQFSRGRDGHVAIIGPLYSGSAASLRAGIETAHGNPKLDAVKFDVTGATSTRLPVEQLTPKNDTLPIHYRSFENNRDYGAKTFSGRLSDVSGYDLGRVTMLVEDNTALGSATQGDVEASPQDGAPVDALRSKVQVIRFPREISLLRNAQVAGAQSGDVAVSSGSPPSPYLRFSLRDYSAQDSVPQFSRENTPLSQEAQLMTIARQLHRLRAQFIELVASNVLDQVFLAQFLHRACPDARLVFFGADVLMVREIDNVPFIGSITITPYPLIGLGAARRTYSNSASEAYYNAASYTFWGGAPLEPLLQGYRNLADRNRPQPPLWATAIGSDGYYPLGILSSSSSDHDQILPLTPSAAPSPGRSTLYPSRLWEVLCALVCLLCALHIVMLWAADYWSPFTRDLAIEGNDQPRRRSMYIHVAAAMLSSMAFIVSLPVLSLWSLLNRLTQGVIHISPWSEFLSAVTLAVGISSVISTIWKTRRHVGWVDVAATPSERPAGFRRAYDLARANVYLFLNLAALATLVVVPALWGYLCSTGSSGGSHPPATPYFVGLCFSYRALNPGSGVSPMVPVLLLLFSWYVWTFFQTWRLRFSDDGRPRLPERINEQEDGRFFVPDNVLQRCDSPRDPCLYSNITCLLISRALLCRFLRFRRRACLAGDIVLVIAYTGLMVWFSFLTPMRSLDHFLFNTGAYRSSPYEFLLGVLFFPLIVVSLTGWLRMILIWGALRRGLLERLENMPIRFAFTRFKGMGWMTMLRQAGLREQWRDMARSMESMRQMLHQPDLKYSMPQSEWRELEIENAKLLDKVKLLHPHLHAAPPAKRAYSGDMKGIELEFAAFSQRLLSSVLIPYWANERTGQVQSEGEPCSAETAARPARILVAEEFLAIRYISLIRAVLTNMRYLMVFVTASFVLAILAWNSYPFQPHQLVDWLFTGLLALLGSGFIWVFAQMHRNPILSRITDTKANELGWDFYLRVISFGAVPVLTWLAYEFPDIGSMIFRLIQPGVPVIK